MISLDEEIVQLPKKGIDQKIQTIAKDEFTLRFKCTSAHQRSSSYVTLSTNYLKEIYNAYLLNVVKKAPQKHEDIIWHLLSKTSAEDLKENTYAELAHIPKGMFPKFFRCLKDFSFLNALKPEDLIIVMHMANWFSLDALVCEALISLKEKSKRLNDEGLKACIDLEKRYPCECGRDELDALEFTRCSQTLKTLLDFLAVEGFGKEKTADQKKKVVDLLLSLGKSRYPQQVVAAVDNTQTQSFVFAHLPTQELIQGLVDNFSAKELEEMKGLFSKHSEKCFPIFQNFMNIPLSISQNLEKIQHAFTSRGVNFIYYFLGYQHGKLLMSIKAGISNGKKASPLPRMLSVHSIYFDKRRDKIALRKIVFDSNKPRVMLGLVSVCGASALASASTGLKQNRAFVLDVVKITGLALQHVSATLRKDPEVVFAAVMNDPRALAFADENLKRNVDFMQMLLAKQPAAFPFISDHLKNHKAFLQASASNKQ